MSQEYWIFEYLYRDAGNFKTHGRLLLTGSVANAEAAVQRCLDWGDQFVAEQVGVPSLCALHWEAVGDGPSDLDHAYHEFEGLKPMESDSQDLLVWGSLAELVARFEKASEGWDVTQSPNCHL